ncbi:MerR family transcriptional regulator [Micromonospora gifhornensis]|uniref:MerR family transcriptional regulator n=1 Tax=Micromonospora gifhornensis TaxID=84594 RepID=UPI001EF3D108|nr:MerR family transcriptional regulator [Micromonospora gifhornensis]
MSQANGQRRRLLRIGELALRTGVSPRMLRHYDNQGLLPAERSATGQRLFEVSAVEQVRSIRLLLDAGLPTRVIAELLECIHEPGRLEPCAVPTLIEHLQAYDKRIAALLSTRTALQGLIDSSSRTQGQLGAGAPR